MSESILLRLYRSQVEAMEETVEAWKAEHREAMLAGDVADVVRACLGWPADMERTWHATFDKIRRGEITDWTKTGQALQGVLDKSLHFLRRVQQWARSLEDAGHSIAGSAELAGDIAKLEAMREQLFEHWPWFTEQDLEEARAAHARGECLPLEEAFASIAGIDKESWLRRVDAHKRAKHP